MTIALYDRGYGWFDKKRRIGPSRWDWFDLLWIHRGAVAISFMDQPPIEVIGGHGVLIYPDTPFAGDAPTAATYASVLHFELLRSRGWLEPIRQIAGRKRGYLHLAHDDIDDDIARAQAMADNIDTPLERDMFIGQLSILLGRLQCTQQTQAMTPHMRAMQDVIEWLEAHLGESISLEQMAERAGMSPSHFRALFRELIGESPGRYFQQLRMNEAARQLRATNILIKQIALRVGYSELANFYRAFRAVHGMTPAAYRNRHALRG
jgi:AraC-like DNA-binding protein